MSYSGKPISDLRFDTLSGQLRDSLSCSEEANKPDFRELDLDSPVSPLRTRGISTTATATSSSSSSSGSVSGRNGHNMVPRRSENNNSGELSGSSESSLTTAARNPKPGHSRSDSSSVNSPPANVMPAGNICPSGRILKTGMNPNRSSKSDVLGSGGGNYGHGSIIRGSGSSKSYGSAETMNTATAGVGGRGDPLRRAMYSSDPEEVKRAGNEMYKKGHLTEALGLYDRAIALAPGNAAYRSNRAAALMRLGQVAAAVRECEEAIRLDPNYWRAHQRLGSLLIR